MGKAESRFVALLDWFIGHHYDTDINLLYRARLLAGMLVVLGMTMLLYVPYMLFLAPVGPATHTVTLQFAAPLVVVYVLLLALIREMDRTEVNEPQLIRAEQIIHSIDTLQEDHPLHDRFHQLWQYVEQLREQLDEDDDDE